MKKKLLAAYILLSFLMVLGLDLELSPFWVAALVWVNFAIASFASRKIEFSNVKP